ncbi:MULTISPECIES: methyltransferase [unclassified Saccharopolyspora]|uniref:methyltransferase n=1 Tax=unclassified Saccharopolyspora TaxID=2646250 RepID=UPI001CD62D92|nr:MULTISPECIES: methyltransferase [unclassified Saccharopolyspora]MCA1190567.1 nuclear transport factor 2 family protein [Saccharopolyspora sp. 6V]MCA1226436.1 nuclear transport factor 2 family protein [Saccharopolyspora sp. 6M]
MPRFFYRALRRGEPDRAAALLAADVEWSTSARDGRRNTLRGREAVLAELRSERGGLFAEPREHLPSGSRVVVLGDYRRDGGAADGTVPFTHVWDFRDGLVVRFEDVHDPAGIRRVLDGEAADLDEIIALGLGFWRSAVLLAAVRLGVFTALSGRELGAVELAERTGVCERGARDFFDCLVVLGLLRRGDGRYRNAAHAAAHLDGHDPGRYVGGLLEEAGTQWYQAWARLPAALAEGTPQWLVPADEVRQPYGWIYAEPEGVRRFRSAMAGGAMTAMLALPRRLHWSRYRTVADVGCCGGEVLAHLLDHHPHLRAIGFDLPLVADAFATTAAARQAAGRVRFVAGNFFTDPLPAADVLVLGHVLHNWGLAEKKLLLRKAYRALPENGEVVIYEVLVDDDRSRHVEGLLMSLHMLVMSPMGFGYTGAECRSWLAEAGFRSSRVEHLAGAEFMVIGTK